jgi:hypothetical protein
LTRWYFFVILTGTIIAVILGCLSYLSLSNSAVTESSGFKFEWTFVGDGRYFLFTMTMLPIVAGYLLFTSKWLTRRKFQRPLQFFFFICVFLQLSHTLYFIGRRFDPLALNGQNVLLTYPVQSYVKNRISELKQEGWNVAISGNDETVANWATLNGENGILQLDELLSADVRPKKKSVVFVMIENKAAEAIGKHLTEKAFKMEKAIDKVSIFSKSFEASE